MNKLLLAAAAATAAFAATAASAATTISFASYQYMLPSDEVLLTNFSSGKIALESGTGAIVHGRTAYSAPPALSPTTKVAGNYLAINYGKSETFNFSSGIYSKGISEISFYVGSLDKLNKFSFSDGTFYWGSDVDSASSATANGNQSAGYSNGLVTFKFDKPITKVVLSSKVPSFEIAEIGVARVPEPASWALMIAGVGMVGGALRARRTRSAMNAA